MRAGKATTTPDPGRAGHGPVTNLSSVHTIGPEVIEGIHMPANILVVEDEPAIQELIALNLEHAGHHVLRARDAEQAGDPCATRSRPGSCSTDAAAVGVTLPAPCARTSARSTSGDHADGARARADKVTGRVGRRRLRHQASSLRELLARIKAVPGAGAAVTDEPIEIGGLRLDPSTHRVIEQNAPVDLDPTEFRLLHFLMAHPERVHSRSNLLDQVWGDHVFVEERTVDVHIRRLRKALEPTGHDRLIETVRGSGYRLAGTVA
jgi:two-component system phosphate regulon response regulator PhoB